MLIHEKCEFYNDCPLYKKDKSYTCEHWGGEYCGTWRRLKLLTKKQRIFYRCKSIFYGLSKLIDVFIKDHTSLFTCPNCHKPYLLYTKDTKEDYYHCLKCKLNFAPYEIEPDLTEEEYLRKLHLKDHTSKIFNHENWIIQRSFNKESLKRLAETIIQRTILSEEEYRQLLDIMEEWIY